MPPLAPADFDVDELLDAALSGGVVDEKLLELARKKAGGTLDVGARRQRRGNAREPSRGQQKAKTWKDVVTGSKTGMPDKPLKLTDEEVARIQAELEALVQQQQNAKGNQLNQEGPVWGEMTQIFLAVLAGLVLTAMLLKWCQDRGEEYRTRYAVQMANRQRRRRQKTALLRRRVPVTALG